MLLYNNMVKEFNVIVYDYNKKTFTEYNIMPVLRRELKGKDLHTFEEFKDFVKKTSMYYWAYKCEYEIILTDWPNQTTGSKIDVNSQVQMNIDLITRLLMEDSHV